VAKSALLVGRLVNPDQTPPSGQLATREGGINRHSTRPPTQRQTLFPAWIPGRASHRNATDRGFFRHRREAVLPVE